MPQWLEMPIRRVSRRKRIWEHKVTSSRMHPHLTQFCKSLPGGVGGGSRKQLFYEINLKTRTTQKKTCLAAGSLEHIQEVACACLSVDRTFRTFLCPYIWCCEEFPHSVAPDTRNPLHHRGGQKLEIINMCQVVFPVKAEGQSPSLTLSTSLCSLEILGISQFVSSFRDPPCNPSDHFLCPALCHPAFLEGNRHQVQSPNSKV